MRETPYERPGGPCDRAGALCRPRPGSILVPAVLGRNTERLLVAATGLANRLGAGVIGFTCLPDVAIAGADAREARAVEILARESKSTFVRATREARRPTQWRGVVGQPIEALEALAWAADLIVLDRSAYGTLPALSQLDALVARIGAPVILWGGGDVDVIFDRILIDWSDRPATQRAIRAALPLLLLARQVSFIQAALSLEICLYTRGFRADGCRVLRQLTPAVEAASTLLVRGRSRRTPISGGLRGLQRQYAFAGPHLFIAG